MGRWHLGVGARIALGAGSCLVAALALTATLSAHDIPNDVIVQAFLKPEGNRARLLLRVPMKGMIDVEVPLRERGYLNIPVADQALRDAALVWLARNVRLYEDVDGGSGPTPLPEPEIIAALASLPSDQSYREYDSALAHIMGPRLPDDTQLYWEEGLLDVLLEYPIASDRSRFWIELVRRLAQRVTIACACRRRMGATALRAHDDPALSRSIRAGTRRCPLRSTGSITSSTESTTLFLLCLVIRCADQDTDRVVTAFTVAQSITLIGLRTTLRDGAVVPADGETLIAARSSTWRREHRGVSVSRRWIITFCFGS